MQNNSNLTVNKKVFFPTLFFLVLTLSYSIRNNDIFLATLNAINDWILFNFGWLFTGGAFSFLIILTVIYFSPLGKVRIGGARATPLLSKWKWFAITLCTTVATGILFWGSAEPLFHLQTPPEQLNLAANSAEAATFAMSTMYMHWSFTPYGIYTITGLAFALSYYNFNRPYRISSLLFPLFGKIPQDGWSSVLDIFCLYALVAGMAASFGTGIFALMGGLENIFGITHLCKILGKVYLLFVSKEAFTFNQLFKFKGKMTKQKKRENNSIIFSPFNFDYK